ncbi:MAG: EAL domain-containing protein [Pseudomonadota bacterium]|nr:EAL domain-containing protein [Pseudomonadota bacterium]
MSNTSAFVAAALLLTGMPACACRVDGSIFAVSPELDTLLGMPVSGRRVQDIFAAADARSGDLGVTANTAARAKAGLAEASVFRTAVQGAFCAIAVQVRTKPFFVEGRLGGATFTFVDMRAAELSRTALHGALLERDAMLENAAVGIFFTKPGVLISCNRRMAEMIGYTQEELADRDSADIFPSQFEHDTLLAEANFQLRAGRPFEKREYHAQRRDGTMFWAHIRARAIDPEARDAGTIWIVEDITEARRAVSEVQALMTNATVSILFTKDRMITRVNSGFARMFGYPEPAPMPMKARQLYGDDATYQRIGASAYPALREGQSFHGETAMVRSDGTRIWVQLIGYLVAPGDMEQGTIWIIEDVTARVEAADAVRRARDELEVRVLARTAELAGANDLLQAEIAERRQAEARVHRMAYFDPLTSLPNRALLADRLERAVVTAQRSNRKLAVMFLDLDRFKTINDSLGHVTGDYLLREVAHRLVGAVRAGDTVARLGGDEFVVVAPGLRSSAECALVGDKIIAALAVPFLIEGRTLHILPSIGMCLYPEDGEDVETLMRHADAAMYAAKAAGRNNYQFFTPRMNQAAALRFEIDSNLRGALARGEFELYYQPLFETSTRRLCALEVLLRWRRPGLDMMMPDDFIPILEENGMIVPVGEWVMRHACEQSMAWQRAGLPMVPIAVNLSARQFMHGGLVETIRAIIDDTGIDPAMLECEITETALMEHGEQTLEILGQIEHMGVKLSIDDFGTGYSSLAYLKRFPVHTLKIDRAFIRDLETSSEDRAIVAAIVALSGSLQLSVVAEGVETEAQFALLREHGCNVAQGYLFSTPVDAATTERMLQAIRAKAEMHATLALMVAV